MIGGHGNDLQAYEEAIRGDFSSNIPYRNASKRIAEHLRNTLSLIDDYPDPYARRLTQLIAAHHAVSPLQIMVTNGSAEAFYLLAHLFAGRHSTIAYPSFAEYEDACRVYQHALTFIAVEEAGHTQQMPDGDALWLAVPNNPTGTVQSRDTLDRLCRENPHTEVIVDTAYGELCPQCEPLTGLHEKQSNFISVHSLTKTFGIPGLRLGYVIARRDIIDALRALSVPWAVNALAQEAGSYVMQHYRDLLPDSNALCREAALFREQLRTVPHLTVYDSPCHFFLARLETKHTAAELKTFLINRYGLLIRDAANFRGLSPQHFRLSVQEPALNEALTDGLKEFTIHHSSLIIHNS
ncbi:MAG TPA: aminotransferase [Porphyromonadaceae bacterium]|jgi:threonine-phosphate decarboxylase|nr:aminotransferase [Porphyromonadaceae bacterium]HBX19750.1 aminotransferase [Porphyromonadaceae bacterium]HCM21179.1 aminotransferase [Porphyromonadaceae bacterium]